MRPLPVLSRAAAAAALVLVAAACTAGEAPGWTYQPAPAATPRPSVDASGEPSPGATPTAVPSPTDAAGASASAPASPGGDEPVVQVVAVDATAWETPELEAPADTAFTLEFDNRDPVAPHNVVITATDGSTVDIGDTTPFTGPEVREYQVPALEAGEYPFLCQVHPTTMTGTLTVQ